MKIIYKSETVENIINALNNLTINGIPNAEIITYIVRNLNENDVMEDEFEEQKISGDA